MTERRKDVLAVAFLVILITVFFSRELFTDRTLVTFRLYHAFPWITDATPEQLAEPSVTSDCTFSYLPRRIFATRMMREGHIPLWNPYQFCGTPFLANYQSGVLYPVNLVLYAFDPYEQMDLYLYAHFLIAAVFTYLLARRLGISLGGSLVAAVGFTFSGFMGTRYGQPTFVSTASYIPALLYFAEGLLVRPTLRRAGFLAAAVAMCMLAGFPQLVFLAVYSLGLYVIVRLLMAREVRGRKRMMIAGLVVFSIVVSSLVCAFQLLPTYEFSTFSYRKDLPYEMILSSAHGRLAALKYFIPDILGHPLDPEVGVLSKELHRVDIPYGFSQNYVSTTGYAGVLTILLALLALAHPRRRMVPFMALAALALLTVFGTPLLRVFYSVLPGFKFSRIDRIIAVYMMGVSVLAGFGFDLASRGVRDVGRGRTGGAGARTVNLIVAAAFAGFAVALGLWLRTSGTGLIVRATGDVVTLEVFRAYAAPKIATFLLLSAAGAVFIMLTSLKPISVRAFTVIALTLMLVDLVPFAARFKVSQPAAEVLPVSAFVESLNARTGRSRIVKYAADVLPASTPTMLEIDDVHGYDALNVNHYVEVMGAIDSTVVATENAALRRRIGPLSLRKGLSSRLLDMLNAVHILTAVRIEGLVRAVSVTNEGVLPRAYLVPRARYFGTYPEVLDYMKTGEFDPETEILLVGEGPAEADTSALAGRAGMVDYGPQEVVIGTEAERDCYLFVSDTYYPGWRAFIDGGEAPLMRANYAFRGLRLPAGKHEVRMIFEPAPFRIGIILSVAGLVLLAVLVVSKSAAQGL
jgi:hypothetical protein